MENPRMQNISAGVGSNSKRRPILKSSLDRSSTNCFLQEKIQWTYRPPLRLSSEILRKSSRRAFLGRYVGSFVGQARNGLDSPPHRLKLQLIGVLVPLLAGIAGQLLAQILRYVVVG